MFSKLLCALLLLGSTSARASLEAALAAEANWNSPIALELFLAADRAKPDDPYILQKIAQQYADLIADQLTNDTRQNFAQAALAYAQRATALDANAINVLSVAVAYGSLAAYSDTGKKIQYSRLVRSEAERALRLDPDYAWAHHVLGRWHYEIASLGISARLLVRLLYGGLPAASFEESQRHLSRAIALEPKALAHPLELGFAYAAAGQLARAKIEWQRGLTMPALKKYDQPAKLRAQSALEALN